jgi:alginate O-acetyltransferase complex protein AlgI
VFFNSQTFLYLFLPAALLLTAGPRRTRDIALLALSVGFYAWGERAFVAVLLASLVVNYLAARWVEATHSRWVLAAAVAANLALLGWLKYAGFLARSVSAGWQSVGGSPLPVPDPHLPIGVSFFTFQAISYLVDVSRRTVPAERSFLRFGLYVFLFPHLIAGPIVRYADLAGQLRHRDRTLEQFAEGVRRIVHGLAKKVLLADTLAQTADAVFALPPGELAASAAWLGVGCYTLQIYFDFSGYSDMAIGLGKLFGFDFAENFRHPYAAASVTDFWRRWHMSLSGWFRDYVYIPLGGNRAGPGRTYLNLVVVFLLCGLWHGANWTFVAWGFVHGGFLVAERAGLGDLLNRLPAAVRHGYTLAAVMVGWAVFRATDLPHAGGVLAAMAGATGGTYTAADLLTNTGLAAILAGCVACLPVLPWLRDRLAEPVRTAVGVPATAGLTAACLIALAGQTYSAFIYFRF